MTTVDPSSAPGFCPHCPHCVAENSHDLDFLRIEDVDDPDGFLIYPNASRAPWRVTGLDIAENRMCYRCRPGADGYWCASRLEFIEEGEGPDKRVEQLPPLGRVTAKEHLVALTPDDRHFRAWGKRVRVQIANPDYPSTLAKRHETR